LSPLENEEYHNSSKPWALFGTPLELILRYLFSVLMFPSGSVSVSKARFNEIKLREWLFFTALVSLIVMPFVLVFTLAYYFNRYAEDLLAKNSSRFGTRDWTALSKWRMRQFNELPHFHLMRLKLSHSAADEYISAFPAQTRNMLSQSIGYISGALAAFLALIALIDSTLLLQPFFSLSLLAWLTVLSAMTALMRSLQRPLHRVRPEQALKVLTLEHTFYCPTHWRNYPTSIRTRDELCLMYPPRIVLILHEITAIILMPLVLCNAAIRSSRIVKFIESVTVRSEDGSDSCAFAQFKFEVSELSSGMKHEAADLSNHNNVREMSQQSDFPHSQHLHMEKSFVSFALQHPQWRFDHQSEAADLLQKVADLHKPISNSDRLSQTSVAHDNDVNKSNEENGNHDQQVESSQMLSSKSANNLLAMSFADFNRKIMQQSHSNHLALQKLRGNAINMSQSLHLSDQSVIQQPSNYSIHLSHNDNNNDLYNSPQYNSGPMSSDNQQQQHQQSAISKSQLMFDLERLQQMENDTQIQNIDVNEPRQFH